MRNEGVGEEAAGAVMLELERVTVARGDREVLRDVSFRMRAGEHVAILGPNGCGKSTLLKTMTCELYPMARPETRVKIFGRARWDLTELRRRMGLVSAELPGRATLTTTGADAVLTGFFGSSTMWPHLAVTAEMRVEAEATLLEVGGEDLRGRMVGEMSAGQQRRVMIARALVGSRAAAGRDGAMLLLDEPSNALDLPAQAQVRGLLRELAAKGTSLVLITHHVADIVPEVGRVLLMREGRVVADGGRRELLTGKVLSELFGAEVTLVERDGLLHAW